MVELCHPDKMIAAAKRGDLTVLEEMTHCYGQRLAAEGRRRCRTPEEAEDAVQDALLSAGQHLTDFRGEGSLEGWLVRMVANACHRLRRGRKNDPTLHVFDKVLEADQASPERQVAEGELLGVLAEVMEELSPTDRLILLLAEGRGDTGPEIGEELGLTAQAVRSRLSRARKRVRAELSERLEQPEPGA
ncbi:MAG: sigma-70 family RNA polymerase sigma factor [Deltaproteobacteria bacterium]|nr:MAG: sigma-70 family RNA polymerase sigma factor [Deltaproteobacteria bacterium]